MADIVTILTLAASLDAWHTVWFWLLLALGAILALSGFGGAIAIGWRLRNLPLGAPGHISVLERQPLVTPTVGMEDPSTATTYNAEDFADHPLNPKNIRESMREQYSVFARPLARSPIKVTVWEQVDKATVSLLVRNDGPATARFAASIESMNSVFRHPNLPIPIRWRDTEDIYRSIPSRDSAHLDLACVSRDPPEFAFLSPTNVHRVILEGRLQFGDVDMIGASIALILRIESPDLDGTYPVGARLALERKDVRATNQAIAAMSGGDHNPLGITLTLTPDLTCC